MECRISECLWRTAFQTSCYYFKGTSRNTHCLLTNAAEWISSRFNRQISLVSDRHARHWSPVCCHCLVAKLCLTLVNPMDYSTPSFCPSLSPGVCLNSCSLSWQWQLTPIFLSGKSHGWRSLVGYSQSVGSQRVGHDWATPFSLLSWRCYLLSHPLPPPSPLAFSLSQHQGLFQWVGSSHQVAEILGLQHQFFQWIFRVNFLLNWLIGLPCSLRDSQKSSPAPQLESINSSVLNLFNGPTLTSVHDYWKNYSFDYVDFCQQSDVSAF